MTTLAKITFESTTFDVVDQDGTPWLKSSDVANALGYSRSDKIGRLYQRNADEFTSAMTAVIETPTLGASGNLTTETRIFSLRGAHLLAMFARTEKAKTFRVWILDLIEREAPRTSPLPNLYKQNPGDKLNSYQQQQLRGLLEEFVKHLPKDKQAGFMMQGWSKLKSHFGVAYREIPCERFDEAVSLLTRHVVEHAKPQPIEAQPGRIRVSPQALIENAAHIAGQLFGEALKQGALGGSPIDRFVVTADYKGGRCNMEVIEHDAYILPIPRLAEVIRSHEPIALSEVAALMGACAEKLARHHAPRLAA